METSPLAKRLSTRFVAGETLDQALAVCRKLNSEGITITLDHLGECVTTLDFKTDTWVPTHPKGYNSKISSTYAPPTWQQESDF